MPVNPDALDRAAAHLVESLCDAGIRTALNLMVVIYARAPDEGLSQADAERVQELCEIIRDNCEEKAMKLKSERSLQ